MGGKNAPAVFQQMMDKIFKDKPSSELEIYLDDLCGRRADSCPIGHAKPKIGHAKPKIGLSVEHAKSLESFVCFASNKVQYR
jgi:hypothetical protein